jgi:hypothetical protein
MHVSPLPRSVGPLRPQALAAARERLAGLEERAARADELATALEAAAAVRGAHAAEVEESRRGVALMEAALGVRRAGGGGGEGGGKEL